MDLMKTLNGFEVLDQNTRDMISDAYSNVSTYAVGNYCIYGNTLYKCVKAVEAAEEFDYTNWRATTVADMIAEIKEQLEEQVSEINENSNDIKDQLEAQISGVDNRLGGQISNINGQLEGHTSAINKNSTDITKLAGQVESINNALPYTIVIDDAAKTINFIDRK